MSIELRIKVIGIKILYEVTAVRFSTADLELQVDIIADIRLTKDIGNTVLEIVIFPVTIGFILKTAEAKRKTILYRRHHRFGAPGIIITTNSGSIESRLILLK